MQPKQCAIAGASPTRVRCVSWPGRTSARSLPGRLIVDLVSQGGTINPLETIPMFIDVLHGKDRAVHLNVARKSCLYATYLMFFFLVFGTLLLKVFGVSLSMIPIVGGIVLLRIGFELFAPSSGGGIIPTSGSKQADGMDVAFTPLAMPIMFCPGSHTLTIWHE